MPHGERYFDTEDDAAREALLTLVPSADAGASTASAGEEAPLRVRKGFSQNTEALGTAISQQPFTTRVCCKRPRCRAGLAHTSQPKAQAILELLASYTIAEQPVVLFLTDGILYHRLRLTPGNLHVANDLEPRTALYVLCQDLKAASINPAFRSHQLADAEHKAFLGEMHAVRGSSALQKLS